MSIREVGLVLAAFGVLAAGAPPAWAQMPGDELPNTSRVRNEFLASTYADVKLILADWQTHLRSNNAVKLGKLFTEDGLYSPVEGWYVQGRTALVDTMAVRIPKIQSYHQSLIDFTASGGLAYYLGRMSYRRAEGAGTDVNGTFVMVLYLDGRRWKIRSYVERLGAPD
jgi:hypothetical protein